MRFLVDEMFTPAVAARLGELRHDALSVQDGWAGAKDDDVFDLALEQSRVLVTEDLCGFSRILSKRAAAGDSTVPIVFVQRRDFRKPAVMADRVAARLDRWARDHPEPLSGPHWLSSR